MTLKQEKWVKGYLETGNLAEASRIAGYKVGSKGGKEDATSSSYTLSHIGQQNLQKLSKEIEIGREREGLAWLTPEYILTSLNKIAADKKAPFRAKISALELLGKSLALFTDKVETKNQILQVIGELRSEWREEN